MARITVLGGTGYAGGHIVREAASRGHQVTAYARHAPNEPVAGVQYRTASILDDDLEKIVTDADVVVEALAPRGDLEGKLRGLVAQLAQVARQRSIRLAVVGGAGSLLVSPGGPAVADTPEFPDEFKPEAAEMAAILDDLRSADASLDWFYLSPAGGFGSWAPGEATGRFRLGGDLLMLDADNGSFISGADFAQALVDEIEIPKHSRQRFSVAY